MVGQPGFEPGSRDPQPRSIDQANLQAPSVLRGYLFVQNPNLTVNSVLSSNAERCYLIDQIDMSNEHSTAAIPFNTKII